MNNLKGQNICTCIWWGDSKLFKDTQRTCSLFFEICIYLSLGYGPTYKIMIKASEMYIWELNTSLNYSFPNAPVDILEIILLTSTVFYICQSNWVKGVPEIRGTKASVLVPVFLSVIYLFFYSFDWCPKSYLSMYISVYDSGQP